MSNDVLMQLIETIGQAGNGAFWIALFWVGTTYFKASVFGFVFCFIVYQVIKTIKWFALWEEKGNE